MSAKPLKINAETGQNGSKAAKVSQKGLKGRIMVVDDDHGMRSLLTDVFSSLGYEVIGQSDAIGALKELSPGGRKVDAVICDLNMPRVSGLELLEFLARMGNSIPVILITAFGTSRTEEQARKLGAFGYLSKPFQLTEVKGLVERAVGGKA